MANSRLSKKDRGHAARTLREFRSAIQVARLYMNDPVLVKVMEGQIQKRISETLFDISNGITLLLVGIDSSDSLSSEDQSQDESETSTV